jgi:hypothetical protein
VEKGRGMEAKEASSSLKLMGGKVSTGSGNSVSREKELKLAVGFEEKR